jgi:hypothetical protein
VARAGRFINGKGPSLIIQWRRCIKSKDLIFAAKREEGKKESLP